jgi:transposase
VLGDRAYDGKPVRKVIAAMGAEAVIPPHPGRKAPNPYDAYLYKARHAKENGFAKHKQCRSFSTRYDRIQFASRIPEGDTEKTARHYAAQVALACIRVWLRL